MKIYCVIPAYNEAAHIKEVILAVRPYVNCVVVVDDCSKDETLAIARGEGIVALSHIVNRGQGAALQTGNEYALSCGADIIVHFDADNQFQAQEIPELLRPILENKAEAVLGSRFLSKKSKLPKLKEYLIMPLARFVNRTFFNIRLSDPQSGFRVLSKKAAKSINIKNDGMAHCSEIMHQLHQANIIIEEVPITVIYHEFGQKLSGGIRIMKDMLIKKIIN